MREILFRGKRVDNGEWVYGYLTEIEAAWDRYEYGSLPVEFEFAIVRTDLCIREVVVIDQKTIGQYTGLTDKNGKKIFEGDIVKFIAGKENGIFDIKYGNSEFYADWIIQNNFNFMDITTSMKYLQCSSELEVIGNIFDNPELIKEC